MTSSYLSQYIHQALPLVSRHQHNNVDDVLVNDRILEFDLPRYYTKHIELDIQQHCIDHTVYDAPRILLNRCNKHELLNKACNKQYINTVKYIVSNDLVDVNYIGKFRDTALSRAAHYDSLELVQYLVECGADVDAINGDHYTVSANAVSYSNNPDIIKYLVYSGADVNAYTYPESNVLIETCHKLDMWPLDVIQCIVEHSKEPINEFVNSVSSMSKNSILTRACRDNRFDIVQYIVDCGANVNGINYGQSTPLMIACRCSPINMDMIQYLVKSGADINAINHNNNTALLKLCKHNNLELSHVQYFVESGANILHRGNNNNTILHTVIQYAYNYPEIVRYLIAYCINKYGNDVAVELINARNNKDKTALMYAMKVSYNENKCDIIDLINILLKQGAHTSIRDSKGYTVWDYDNDDLMAQFGQ